MMTWMRTRFLPALNLTCYVAGFILGSVARMGVEFVRGISEGIEAARQPKPEPSPAPDWRQALQPPVRSRARLDSPAVPWVSVNLDSDIPRVGPRFPQYDPVAEGCRRVALEKQGTFQR